MRHLINALCLSLAVSGTVAAQYGGGGTQALMGNKRSDVSTGCRRVYFALSTGLNNPVGFAGLQVDVAITQRISVCTGMGLGSWGPKASLEGRYYFGECNRGFALAAGGTYALGGTEVVVPELSTANGRETVTFLQRAAFNAQLGAYYFTGFGRRGHRAHFQAGYSLPLHGDRIQQLGGTAPATPPVRKLDLMPPGGPIVAAGVSFGIGRF